MIRKTMVIVAALFAVSLGARAQAYCGEHQFDGEHKNEVSGYVMAGDNVVSGRFGGLAGSYMHHFTPRWHVGGDAQVQMFKQLYSIDVQGGYRLPVKYGHIYFDAKGMFNFYHRWGFTESLFNLSATWESAYVDIRLGESLIHFRSTSWGIKYGYTEPLTLTFGIGANLRHRSNPWNVGLFFRNYDDFYYENWNINWGIRFYATLYRQMRLFGEFNVRPAGSISQLASRYEGSMKLGLKYKF